MAETQDEPEVDKSNHSGVDMKKVIEDRFEEVIAGLHQTQLALDRLVTAITHFIDDDI